MTEPSVPPSPPNDDSPSRLRALLDSANADTHVAPRRAVESARAARTLALAINDVAGTAEAERLLARGLSNSGDEAAALEHALSAVERYEALQDEAGLIQALNGAGLAFQGLGEFEGALDHLSRAQDLARRIGRRDLELTSLGNLSVTCSSLRNFAQARELLSRTLAMSRELAHGDFEMRTLTNLGNVDLEEAQQLLGEGRQEDAQALLARSVEYSKLALEFAGRGGNVYFESIALVNLAAAYVAMGDTALASELLPKALRAAQDVGDDTGVAAALMESGVFARQRGRWDEAASALHQAKDIAQRIGAKPYHARAWLELSRVHETQGHFKLALQAFKRHYELEREMQSEKADNRARAFAVKMNLERTHLEAELLRLKTAELAASNARLQAEASVLDRYAREDALTGLYNRRYFDERLAAKLAGTSAGQPPFVLALADIDHFKRTNDNFSHVVGDNVLREIATILRAHCRPQDFVARFGGEEFALVFDALSLADATSVCERLRESVAQHAWSALAAGLAVTISIGVCEHRDGACVDSLIERADALLYLAKSRGRNRVCA